MDLQRALDQWVPAPGAPAAPPAAGPAAGAAAPPGRDALSGRGGRAREAPAPPADRALAVAEALREAEAAEAGLCQQATALVQGVAPGCEVTVARSVAGRMVFAVDGAVDQVELERAHRVVSTSSYRRAGFARPDTQDVKHSISNYPPREFAGTPLCGLVKALLAALFPGRPRLVLSRAYCNAKLFGDVGLIHRDTDSDGQLTAVLYANLEWGPELCGETMFYTPDSMPALAVAPIPGRLCLFDGLVLHAGVAPSRLMFGYRFTLALKFRPARTASEGDFSDSEGDASEEEDGRAGTASMNRPKMH